ncbi:hypothetical protein D3C80_1765880 [compost metagenome]
MQPDPVADQQRRQHHALQRLTDHEHRHDTQHGIQITAKLKQAGDQCRADANDESHVRHNCRQTGNHTDQQPQLQTDQHQPRCVNHAQCDHHHQLPANERAEHFVAFACQGDSTLLAITR